MKIQVIGSSCPNCKKFYDSICQIVSEMQIGEAVEYVDDLRETIKIGVMTSPALLIDGEVVLVGGHHSRQAIRSSLINCKKSEVESISADQVSGCSCCLIN